MEETAERAGAGQLAVPRATRILAFASRVAPTDRPDIGYAMIFPSMTVAKFFLCRLQRPLISG
jgi:hypothetical protein